MASSFRNAALIAAMTWLTGPASPVCAQPAAQASSPIRCAQCPLSGQRPGVAPFDESQVTFVGPLRLAFHENRTVQTEVIARVLLTSPFVLEVLDDRTQLLDRSMKPVRPDMAGGEDHVCGITRIESVDLASKQIVTRLRFNDVIAARMVRQRNEQNPEAFLLSTQVLTGIRTVSAPIRYLNAPAPTGCANRSGRLLEYRGIASDALTVYNDGAIHYRDLLGQVFETERLSGPELAELLQAFGSARFDAIPADMGPVKWGPRPGITFLGARYQDVWLGGNEGPLAPLVQRMNDLIARAMSHSYLLLKAGRRQRLTIEAWPYDQVDLTRFRELKNRALTRRPSEAGDALPGSVALEERLPDAFLDRLPVKSPIAATAADPNRYLYFSQAGRLYRVTHDPLCPATVWYCKTFYGLEIEEIQSIEASLRAQAGRTYVVTGYSGPNRQMPETRAADPARLPELGLALNDSGYAYLWTSDMGTGLAGLPPEGSRISNEEYDRHKPVYFAILRNLESGVDLIENGFVFEHVRVCRIRSGIADGCEIR